MNEAAKSAWQKMFSLHYTFRPLSIFSQYIPVMIVAFRCSCMLNATHPVPTMQLSDEKCLLSLKMQSQLLIENPWRHSHEYDSLMQIVIEDLLGWDIKCQSQKHKGISGGSLHA